MSRAPYNIARENVAYKFCNENIIKAYILVSSTCVTLLPYNTN